MASAPGEVTADSTNGSTTDASGATVAAPKDNLTGITVTAPKDNPNDVSGITVTAPKDNLTDTSGSTASAPLDNPTDTPNITVTAPKDNPTDASGTSTEAITTDTTDPTKPLLPTETSTTSPSLITHAYASQKTFSTGGLHVGFLVANVAQLRSVISEGPSVEKFYWVLLVGISLSIFLHVVNCAYLLILGTIEANQKCAKTHAATLTLITTVFTYIIAAVNVVVAGFAFGAK